MHTVKANVHVYCILIWITSQLSSISKSLNLVSDEKMMAALYTTYYTNNCILRCHCDQYLVSTWPSPLLCDPDTQMQFRYLGWLDSLLFQFSRRSVRPSRIEKYCHHLVHYLIRTTPVQVWYLDIPLHLKVQCTGFVKAVKPMVPDHQRKT